MNCIENLSITVATVSCSCQNQFAKSYLKPNSGVKVVVIMAKLSTAFWDLNIPIENFENNSIMKPCQIVLPCP
jgi:hypothetical protein